MLMGSSFYTTIGDLNTGVDFCKQILQTNLLSNILRHQTKTMKYFLTILTILFVTTGAMAQQKTKKENIRELLTIMGSEKQAKLMINMMIDTYRKTASTVSDEFWDELVKELKTDELVDMVVPIYEKYYSDEEIVQLLAFYKSPLGQKVIERLPLITQESYKVGETWGRKMGEKIVAKLQAKGYTQ